MLELVPRETARLRAELDGRRADYDGERRGTGFTPGRPLYGPPDARLARGGLTGYPRPR